MSALPRDTRILFIAMSRNQGKYFQRLIDLMEIDGRILYAKHPGLANPVAALKWVRGMQARFAKWIGFRRSKDRLNESRDSALFRWGLLLRIVHFMSGMIGEVRDFRPQAVFLWNGAHYKQQAAIDYCREQNIQVLYLELGFLPDTMAIDGLGVNYANSLPRDAAFYRAYRPRSEAGVTELLRRVPRKPVGEPLVLPENYIFVPFQVYDDTQILVNSPWIRSMEALHAVLMEVADALPEGWRFIVKEHPTSKRDYRSLHGLHSRILFANANDTQELIQKARLVVTINSTVGIESLLLGRPVITLGNACYNIPELVSHADSVETLRHYVAAPDSAVFDVDLVKRFVAYLNEQYLVPERSPNVSPRHGEVMAQRIKSILQGSLPRP